MTVHDLDAEIVLAPATWTVELDLSSMGRGVFPTDRIVLEHVAFEASKQAGRRIRTDSLPEAQLVGQLVEGRKLIGRGERATSHVIARRFRWTGQYLTTTESE